MTTTTWTATVWFAKAAPAVPSNPTMVGYARTALVKVTVHHEGAANMTDLCEAIFERTNSIDQDWRKNEGVTLIDKTTGRSMMIGDRISFGKGVWFQCMPTGWEVLKEATFPVKTRLARKEAEFTSPFTGDTLSCYAGEMTWEVEKKLGELLGQKKAENPNFPELRDYVRFGDDGSVVEGEIFLTITELTNLVETSDAYWDACDRF